jgi:tRNA A-37 threonylcarbamoyl transferase component Bud32
MEDNMRDVLSRITREYVKKRIPVSIRMTVPGIGEVICADLLRVVPSRRITCVGSAGEKQLIIKLFYARHGAHRHWKRSDRGCGYFLEKNIPAPEIFYSGYLPHQGIYVMVFEYLEGGIRLRDCIEKTVEPALRNSLLDKLMAVVAQQHEAGIIQHDLHLGNFMAVDGIIYSLDGDHVSSLHRPVGRSRSFRNLAYLFAQNIFLFGNGMDERVMSYVNQRGWQISGREMEEIRGYIRDVRSRMFMKYLWKVFRKECRFLEYSKGMNLPFDAGLNDGRVLSQVFDPSILQPYGEDSTGKGFRLVPTPRGRVPVKECTGYGPIMIRWFWKAGRVWRNMSLLKMLGLNTTDPMIILGRRKGFWKWDCSIVSKPVAGPTFREMFLSDSFPESQRIRAVIALSDILCSLRDAGFIFSRMHPEEIVFDEGKVIFLFVDAVQRLKGNQFSPMIKAFLEQLDGVPGSREMFREQFKKRNLI